MELKLLRNLSAEDLTGKTVFVRVDWNVPIKDGEVVDGFRIIESLETLKFLADHQAVIKVATHLGDKEAPVQPLVNFLAKHFIYPNLEVLPNLRSDEREEQNDLSLAEELAEGCDFYVNEAFSVCHRSHTSIVRLPTLLPAYSGFRLEREVEELSEALDPTHPFVFILGGAKFGTKLPLLEKYLQLADGVFVGGALANSLLKARGVEVGQSLIDNDNLDLSSVINHENLILPGDIVVSDKNTKSISDILPTDKIMDIGLTSISNLETVIDQAKLIVWNGPLGNYENGFAEATEVLAKMIASSKAKKIIGGGDTLTIVNQLNLANKFDFVSTGGGAMLDFLTHGTLPGLELLV